MTWTFANDHLLADSWDTWKLIRWDWKLWLEHSQNYLIFMMRKFSHFPTAFDVLIAVYFLRHLNVCLNFVNVSLLSKQIYHYEAGTFSHVKSFPFDKCFCLTYHFYEWNVHHLSNLLYNKIIWLFPPVRHICNLWQEVEFSPLFINYAKSWFREKSFPSTFHETYCRKID